MILRREFGLLELIDLLIDCRERVVIRSTEVGSPRNLSYLLHRGLIEVYRYVAHDGAELSLERIWGFPRGGSDANRVDGYAKRLSKIRCHLWGDIPRVVYTIGQQDEYFTLGLAVLEAVNRRGNP